MRSCSWTAEVKNRRKDGDHCWVRATVTPFMPGGQLKGQMSVRTEPTRADLQASEGCLFARMRQAQARNRAFPIRLHKGLLALASGRPSGPS